MWPHGVNQKVTISSVPSTAADGTVTKICKLVLERGGGAPSELLAPWAACLSLGIAGLSVQLIELRHIADRHSTLTGEDGKVLYSVLQAERGIPSAHLFDREVHAKLAALRSPTAAQVCALAQLALDADPALASTVARGETSALWILNGGHYMVLEANFEERVLYGANSYLDSGGSYNRALDIVGMRALPLSKAVLDLYLASTSAKGASSTLPWRYTRKLLSASSTDTRVPSSPPSTASPSTRATPSRRS